MVGKRKALGAYNYHTTVFIFRHWAITVNLDIVLIFCQLYQEYNFHLCLGKVFLFCNAYFRNNQFPYSFWGSRRIIIQIACHFPWILPCQEGKESLERGHLCWLKADIRIMVAKDFLEDNVVLESYLLCKISFKEIFSSGVKRLNPHHTVHSYNRSWF